MDETYDKMKAARALEDIARARGKSDSAGIQLSTMCMADNWDDAYSVICTGRPPTWRLVHNATNPNETPEEVADDDQSTDPSMEEAVLSIQGVVLRKKEFPPMTDRLGSNSKAVKFIRQGLTVTGLGTEAFQEATDAIIKIYALFSRSVVSGKNPLQCESLKSFDEDGTIDAFNRYFSKRKDHMEERDVPFSQEIDPNGTLSRMVSEQYVHVEENVVRYFERVTASTGDHRFVNIPPAKIQVGDIVELQVSMIGVPMRGGDYKLSMVLRGVTLIDGSHTLKAIITRLGKRAKTETHAKLTRKVGYSDEELAETKAKLARMDIDSGNRQV